MTMDPNNLYPGFVKEYHDDWLKVTYKGHLVFRCKKSSEKYLVMDSNRCFSFDYPDDGGKVRERIVYYINDLGFPKMCEEKRTKFGIWNVVNDKRIHL